MVLTHENNMNMSNVAIDTVLSSKELILPGYSSNNLTPRPEGGSSSQSSFQQPPTYSTPGSSLSQTYGNNSTCPNMSTHSNQRNNSTGKSAWQTRSKNTPRQQLQQVSIHSPSGGSSHTSSHSQTSSKFNSGNQKLVAIDTTQTPLHSTTSQSLLLPPRPSAANSLSLGCSLGSTPQSSTQSLYPLLQLNSCIEHQNSSRSHTYCILEGLPSNPSSSGPVSYVVSPTQTKTGSKPYYNQTSSNLQTVSVTNRSQQSQYRYKQHYSGGKYCQSTSQSKQQHQQMSYQTSPQQSQLVVFRPPPRERIKSPILQNNNSSNEINRTFNNRNLTQGEIKKYSANSSRHHKTESNRNSSSTSGFQSHRVNDNHSSPIHKTFSPRFNTNENVDAIATLKSTWLSSQPLGNVHLVMGLSAGTALKAQENFQSPNKKEKYPNPIARPTVVIPDPLLPERNPSQTSNLNSDSSTSFDFSIEAEKMVSALCNSCPVKDLDLPDCQNSTDNSDRKQTTLTKKNSEKHLVNNDNKLHQLGDTEDKSNSMPLVNNKDWILTNKAASDDEVSVNTISTSDYQNVADVINMRPLIVNEDKRNVDNFPLGLSSSSNSSSGTAKNIESNIDTGFHEVLYYRDNEPNKGQRKGSPLSSVKVRSISCQTNILEGARDEQLMFRKTTVKGCHEINKIIEEYMCPSLDGLSQFCVEVRKAVSKPEALLDSDSVQKDLIIGFLRLANCWANLYPVLGASDYQANQLNSTSIDIAHVYQNWTSVSRKLMEEIIKIFEHQINIIEHNKELPEELNSTQADYSENIGYSNSACIGHNEYFDVISPNCYPNCCPTTSTLSESYADPLSAVPENVIHDFPPTTSNETILQTFHSTPNHSNGINQNHKSNWRLRRFSESLPENTIPRNQTTINKGKGSFQSSKDSSKGWNILSSGSAVSFHSSYGNSTFCDTQYGNSRKAENNGISSSRISRSDSHVSNERYSRPNTGNRYKQKTNAAGKKTQSLNIEAHLRDKALETLDGFTKQWQKQQFEVLKVNPKSSENQLYIGKMSGDQIPPLPKGKMIPLSQIETSTSPRSPTQHVDLSTWFQNFSCTLPTTVETSQLNGITNNSEVLYSERLNHPIPVIDSSVINGLDVSTPSNKSRAQSARRHSYQDSRSQLIAGKGKTWSNKRNNTHSNHTNVMPFNDEHDSSDDHQDRIYMKPGSYDVPKRRPSEIITRSTTPLLINNVNATIGSPTSVGVIIPFPAAPIVPPPARTMEMSPRILRHIQVPKNQTSSNGQGNGVVASSDIAWKKACQSAGSLLETLQTNGTSPSSSNQTDLEEEIQRIVEGESHNSTNEERERVLQPDKQSEEKEQNDIEKSNTSKRKGSTVKTDHWLIRTLNNASKHQNDNEVQSAKKCEDEQQTSVETSVTIIKNCDTNEEQSNSENHKESDTLNTANEQKPTPSTSKNVINKRVKDGKKEEDPTPKSRKPFNGPSMRKSHLELGRNIIDSRKRKLQERSPNDEQNIQTKTESVVTNPTEIANSEKTQNNSNVNSYSNSNNIPVNKPKSDLRNKATWNVWYSSRRRRGLSILAVNKLEDILNIIWNMEASDFVKYPISSNDLNDYYKHVKHPMFLETIGYKLKNRIYETIEQFVHDFRRIFVNAKLYNKDDPSYIDLTNVLETKFNTLLEDHFSGWEFGHITGDPNETTSIPALRYLAYTEKSTTSKNRRAKSSSKASNPVNSPRSSAPTTNATTAQHTSS